MSTSNAGPLRPPLLAALALAIVAACTPVPAANSPAFVADARRPAEGGRAAATAQQAPAALGSAATPSAAPALDAAAANRRLGRGVNLANALEAPAEGEWGVVLEAGYFDLIQQAGFTAVRLPTRWDTHAQTSFPYTIEPAFLQRVDWAVDQALQRGLAVVLNVHSLPELTLGGPDGRERYLAYWRQIAGHFRHSPDGLIFEPLNEPNGALVGGAWNRLFAEVLAVIRAENPTRTVIATPALWGSASALRDLDLPAADAHLIVTFHYYLPFQFTHQGAEWVDGSGSWLGTTWDGRSAERQAIDFDFNQVADWAQANSRPIFLGEFGAYGLADLDSRVRWTTYVRQAAEARGFSWAYWEFGAGFGVYDRAARRWVEPLLQALLPGS